MYELIRPLLFKLDPEQAHNLTFRMLTSTGGLPKTAAGTLFGPVTPKRHHRGAGKGSWSSWTCCGRIRTLRRQPSGHLSALDLLKLGR